MPDTTNKPLRLKRETLRTIMETAKVPQVELRIPIILPPSALGHSHMVSGCAGDCIQLTFVHAGRPGPYNVDDVVGDVKWPAGGHH